MDCRGITTRITKVIRFGLQSGRQGKPELPELTESTKILTRECQAVSYKPVIHAAKRT